jgi:hypothetical protein
MEAEGSRDMIVVVGKGSRSSNQSNAPLQGSCFRSRPRRPLHGTPRHRLVRRPGRSDQLVAAAAPVEQGDPAPSAVLTEADVKPLVRHPDDDEPDAGAGVQPPMDDPQLRRVGVDEHGGEGCAEATANLRPGTGAMTCSGLILHTTSPKLRVPQSGAPEVQMEGAAIAVGELVLHLAETDRVAAGSAATPRPVAGEHLGGRTSGRVPASSAARILPRTRSRILRS